MMQWIKIVFSNKQTYIWLVYCMYITQSECSLPLLLIFPLIYSLMILLKVGKAHCGEAD